MIFLPPALAAPLSLTQAFALAQTNDAAYEISRYDRDIGREASAKGRAGLLPSVSANIQSFRNHAEVTNFDASGSNYELHPTYISRSSGVQVHQPLYDTEATARYRQGLLQSEQSDIQFGVDSSQLAIRLVNAFIAMILAQEDVSLSLAQLDAIAEQYRTNTALFAHGEGTKTDLIETQARRDLTETALLDARDRLAIQRETLESIVGVKVDQIGSFTENFDTAPPVPQTFKAWSDLMLQENPDLRVEEKTVEIAYQEVRKARSSYMPKLEAIVALSKDVSDSVNTYNQSSTNRAIGLQLTIPIYSGGAVAAGVRQSETAYERAKSTRDLKIQRVLLDAKREFVMVQSAPSRLRALDQAMQSAALLVTATERSIVGGQRSNVDLLNAKQQYAASRHDLVQARANYILAFLRLRSYSSPLTQGDIGYATRWFTAAVTD